MAWFVERHGEIGAGPRDRPRRHDLHAGTVDHGDVTGVRHVHEDPGARAFELKGLRMRGELLHLTENLAVGRAERRKRAAARRTRRTHDALRHPRGRCRRRHRASPLLSTSGLQRPGAARRQPCPLATATTPASISTAIPCGFMEAGQRLQVQARLQIEDLDHIVASAATNRRSARRSAPRGDQSGLPHPAARPSEPELEAPAGQAPAELIAREWWRLREHAC